MVLSEATITEHASILSRQQLIYQLTERQLSTLGNTEELRDRLFIAMLEENGHPINTDREENSLNHGDANVNAEPQAQANNLDEPRVENNSAHNAQNTRNLGRSDRGLSVSQEVLLDHIGERSAQSAGNGALRRVASTGGYTSNWAEGLPAYDPPTTAGGRRWSRPTNERNVENRENSREPTVNTLEMAGIRSRFENLRTGARRENNSEFRERVLANSTGRRSAFHSERPDISEIRDSREVSESRRMMGAMLDLRKKGNVRFSGKRSEDPEEFLRRLKEGIAILRVPESEVLAALPFFLEGISLIWFRSAVSRFRDLIDFEDAFRAKFIDPGFQVSLIDEIRNRTQHEEERVSDFLVNYRSILDRVDPPFGETREVELAICSLLPKIQVQIAGREVRSWAQLERQAAIIERSLLSAKNFRGPPAPESSALPHLSFRGNNTNNRLRKFARTPLNNVEEIIDHEELYDIGDDYYDLEDFECEELAKLPVRNGIARKTSTDSVNNINSARNRIARPEDRCYNCGDLGHYAEACKSRRRMFCHACGKRGVTRKICPACPPIKERPYCTQCGLFDVILANCPECSGNRQ